MEIMALTPSCLATLFNATEVIVAVIDSGIDPLHPDLSGVLWNNDDEIPNNGIDDDANGYIDDTYGWDFTGKYDVYKIRRARNPRRRNHRCGARK